MALKCWREQAPRWSQLTENEMEVSEMMTLYTVVGLLTLAYMAVIALSQR
jgi:hypothetical protein